MKPRIRLKKKWLERIPLGLFILVAVVSLALSFHNASLFNPHKGLDGEGHTFYVLYMAEYWRIPPPGLEWETHQSPLYYVLGAVVYSVTKSMRAVQFINPLVLWAIIAAAGLGLRKIFTRPESAYLGMAALAALPMLNIFPPLITNELLSTFWVINVLVACIYLIDAEKFRHYVLILVWLSASFVLGMWTKVSVLMTLPVLLVAFALVLARKKLNWRLVLLSAAIAAAAAIVLSLPIILRSAGSQGPSNIAQAVSAKPSTRPADFYYRLNWIPKLDMYNTQYYSMTGGAFNSFFTDGHNIITPFVRFHKKSFLLWSFGFVLLPLSLAGLYRLFRTARRQAVLMVSIGTTMLAVFVFTLVTGVHYSAVRLTYEMGIVVPYAAGLVSASRLPQFRYAIWALVLVQFAVLFSFFWIEPWWFVTQ